MDDLTTESGFYLQATWDIAMLGLFFDMLSMGICTTDGCTVVITYVDVLFKVQKQSLIKDIHASAFPSIMSGEFASRAHFQRFRLTSRVYWNIEIYEGR